MSSFSCKWQGWRSDLCMRSPQILRLPDSRPIPREEGDVLGAKQNGADVRFQAHQTFAYGFMMSISNAFERRAHTL